MKITTTNEQIMGSEKLLLLNKHDAYWRMDRETFFRFMSYVSVYFKICGSCAELKYEEIQYVDISYDELKVACVFFGRYFPDAYTLMLAPVNPGRSLVGWGSSFTMYIGEQKDETFTFRPLQMQTA